MTDSVFDDHDALGLAELVRSGDISPTELLDEAIERVDAVDRQFGVLADRYEDFARRQIADGLPEGPFTGVPYLRKDCKCEIAGLSATEGTRLLAGRIAETTAVVAERFLDAGVVVFGATSVPPLSASFDTDRSPAGPCRNPWDPSRTSGGSSAGAAVVVATGALPMAHGNDGGGSLRIPAAWSGAFTVKPSRGRVPNGPVYTEDWLGFATEGVVTRSVRDCAAMLDALAGPETGSRYVAPPPPRSYLAETQRPAQNLRVGVLERDHYGTEFDREYLAATHRTADLLASLGHEVESTPSPEFDIDELSQQLFMTVAVDTVRFLRAVGEERGRPVDDAEIEVLPATIRAHGRTVTGEQYARTNDLSMEAAFAWDRFMQRYDLVLSPTMTKPAPPNGEIYRHEDDLDAYRRDIDEYLNMTMVQNVTGQPAMSVPLWRSDSGMPIGMMFVARYGDESTLFSLAAQLEEAQPWRDVRPPVAFA